MEKQAISGKKKARKLALQALYQWLMSGSDLAEIEIQFRIANNMDKVDVDFFRRLLYGVPKDLTVLEEAFTPFIDRPVQGLNPIELTVLRLGTFELLFCPETPYRVILNEAISLAKEYGSQDGHRYVNGVLNNLAKQIRAVEIQLERD